MKFPKNDEIRWYLENETSLENENKFTNYFIESTTKTHTFPYFFINKMLHLNFLL